MSSVVISGDTSGSITLSAPAVAGTNTATLPAATGTVMVSGNMPAFSVYQGTSQTISPAVFTKVQLNVELFDTANAFDSTTNYRFQPTVAGYYQINTTVRIKINGTFNQMQGAIYKNGTAFTAQNWSWTFDASNYQSIPLSETIYLNGSTDYLELYAIVNTSGTATMDAYSTVYTCKMSGALMRTA